MTEARPHPGERPATPPAPGAQRITTRDAARHMGVTPKTIRLWFNHGHIAGQRVTRSLILIASASIEEPRGRLPPLPAA